MQENIKVKGKGLDTCYSATYMSQSRDQQRFTISEVAADWHEVGVFFSEHSVLCFMRAHSNEWPKLITKLVKIVPIFKRLTLL